MIYRLIDAKLLNIRTLSLDCVGQVDASQRCDQQITQEAYEQAKHIFDLYFKDGGLPVQRGVRCIAACCVCNMHPNREKAIEFVSDQWWADLLAHQYANGSNPSFGTTGATDPKNAISSDKTHTTDSTMFLRNTQRLEQKVLDLKKEKKTLEDRHNELQRTNSAAQTQIVKLCIAINRLRSGQPNPEQIPEATTNDLEQTQLALKRSDSELKRLQRELAKNGKELTAVNSSFQNLQTNVHDLRRTLKDRDASVIVLKVEVTKLEESLELAHDKHNQLSLHAKGLENESAKLDGELANSKKDAKDNSARAELLQQKLLEVEARNERLLDGIRRAEDIFEAFLGKQKDATMEFTSSGDGSPTQSEPTAAQIMLELWRPTHTQTDETPQDDVNAILETRPRDTWRDTQSHNGAWIKNSSSGAYVWHSNSPKNDETPAATQEEPIDSDPSTASAQSKNSTKKTPTTRGIFASMYAH